MKKSGDPYEGKASNTLGANNIGNDNEAKKYPKSKKTKSQAGSYTAALEELGKKYPNLGKISYDVKDKIFNIVPIVKIDEKDTLLSDELFYVQFFQEVDTGKRLVVISKPNFEKRHKFTVSAIGLPDILKLRYGGFEIGVPAELQGFIKEVSRHRAFPNVEIASSIGFTPNRDKFFNCEFQAPKAIPKELSECWNTLLQITQFKQVLICSLLGLGASYLNKRIVPIINVWGAGLNSEIIRMLILSPFGNPSDGYRDIFCKDSKLSRLSYDRDIIPVIADLRSYGDRNIGFEWSGDGYYLDGHGQFHAPLFIVSKTPHFKDIHISIEIPMLIPVSDSSFPSVAVDVMFNELDKASNVLLKYCGLLSFYVGRKLCAESVMPLFKKELNDIRDDRDFSFEEEKRNKMDALGLSIQQVLKSMFRFDAEDWIFDWGGIVYEIDFHARQLYYSMVDFISNSEDKICNSAEDFTDDYKGFLSIENDKEFLYIQEGEFNKIFNKFSEARRHIFDYWIDVLKVSNYRSDRKHQPYAKRVPVGKDRPERKWFFVFCLTDFEEVYPERTVIKRNVNKQK